MYFSVLPLSSGLDCAFPSNNVPSTLFSPQSLPWAMAELGPALGSSATLTGSEGQYQELVYPALLVEQGKLQGWHGQGLQPQPCQ